MYSKGIQKVLTLLVATIIWIYCTSFVTAADSTENQFVYEDTDDFDYTYQDGQVVIYGYHGNSDIIYAPNFIEGIPVYKIYFKDSTQIKPIYAEFGSFGAKAAGRGGNWFYNSNYPDIKFKYEEPQDNMFDLLVTPINQTIETVIIPEGVTVIEGFNDCTNLRDIHLPDSLKKIGGWAFSGCSSLKRITLPDELLEIESYAFYNCQDLQNVYISDSSKISKVGICAFRNCVSLKEINLPYLLEKISPYAFENCSSLNNIIIPENVSVIERWAFLGCSSLESLELNNNLKTISELSFSNCGFSCLDIPDSVTCIKNGAFLGCSNLEKIYLPDNLTELEEGILAGCSNLTDVRLPESLEIIPKSMFLGCSSLEYISIPDSVVEIGEMAFEECELLKNINFPQKLEAIGSNAFWACRTITEIYIPENVRLIDCTAFAFLDNLQRIEVSSNNSTYETRDGVLIDNVSKTIVWYPRYKEETVYHVPDDIENIGAFSFYCCSSLKNVSMGNNVKTIGELAFCACSVESILLSNNIERIPTQAFCDSSLLSIDIPDSVVSIDSDAFAFCSLQEITLSANLKYIGEWAFRECPNLSYLYIPESVDMIEPNIFEPASWDEEMGDEETIVTTTIVYTKGSFAEQWVLTTDYNRKCLDPDEFTNISLGAAAIRNQMTNRVNSFEVKFITGPRDRKSHSLELFKEAVQHTGKSSEGDFLAVHVKRWDAEEYKFYDSGVTYNIITFSTTYLTSAEQEERLDNEINSIISSLNIMGLSDYYKVLAFYNYIVNNITYDYTGLNNNDKLKFSAYSALINKTAVCSGYASLFYKLCLSEGIDCRIITGSTIGTNMDADHSWNIVNIDGKYYCVDPTWGSEENAKDWFLKSDNSFSDHFPDEEYMSVSFKANYPISSTDYARHVFCLPESLTSIEDHAFEGTRVNKIIVPDGCMTIGDRTFANSNIDTIVLPDSITNISDSAFENCQSVLILTDINNNYVIAWANAHSIAVRDEETFNSDSIFTSY